MPRRFDLRGDVDPDVIPGGKKSGDQHRGPVDRPQHIGHARRTDVSESHPHIHIGQTSAHLSGQRVHYLTTGWVTSAVRDQDQRHTGIANR